MSTRTATAPPDLPRARPSRSHVRAQLLTAAREAFLSQGYDRTSLAEVARAAGFTKGAIYSNFGGKEELFAEVCRTEFDTATDQLLADLVETTKHGRRLTLDAATRLGELVTSQSSLQAAAGEFRSLAGRNGEVATVYATMRGDQIARLSSELAQRGLLGNDTSDQHYRSLAITLLGMLNSLALEHRAAPELYPPAELERTMAFLIQGLLP